MARTDLPSRRRETAGSWPSRKAAKPKASRNTSSGEVVSVRGMTERYGFCLGCVKRKVAARQAAGARPKLEMRSSVMGVEWGVMGWDVGGCRRVVAGCSPEQL